MEETTPTISTTTTPTVFGSAPPLTLEEVKARFPPNLTSFVSDMEKLEGLTEADRIDRLRKASRMVRILKFLGVEITPEPFYTTFINLDTPLETLTFERFRGPEGKAKALEVDWESLKARFDAPEGWPMEIRPVQLQPVSSDEFAVALAAMYESFQTLPPPPPSSFWGSSSSSIPYPGKRLREEPAEAEPEEKKRMRSTCGAKKVDTDYVANAKALYLKKKSLKTGTANLRYYRVQYIKSMRRAMVEKGIPLPNNMDMDTHEKILEEVHSV